MKLRHVILLFTFLLSVFASCNFSGKLTRRYRTVEVKDIGDSIRHFVGVSAYINEKEKAEPPKQKTVFDLTEKGQKEFIKQLGINDDTSEKMIAALLSPLSPKNSVPLDVLDYTVAEKRIIITIDNLSHWPADRISKITVLLKINPEFKIVGCSRLATEYQTIDLGKLNYSNTNNLELSGNLAGGLTSVNSATDLVEESGSNKVGDQTSGSKSSNTNTNSNTRTGSNGVSGKFNASRSFSEEVQLRQRIVALNASVEENNTLKLYQDGISGIDLKGNLLADVVFNSDNNVVVDMILSFSEMTTPRGVFNSPSALKVKQTLVKYFNYSSDITGDLAFLADFRKVNGRRHKTITESDDAAELIFGETTKNAKKITLIEKDKLIPKLWVLYDRRDATMMPIQVFNPSINGKGDLIFNSNTMVREFMLWVRQKSTDLVAGSGAIGTSGYVLCQADGSAIDAGTLSNLAIRLK